MEKILTAMGTINLINRLENNTDFLVYEKDIPYREGIIELLKQDNKFNIIIINDNLPGQINLEDLIKNIKLMNEKINIIFFIESRNNILEKILNSENIKFFYKDNFNWNEFILYVKNINKKLNEKKNIIINKNEKINNKEKKNLYDSNEIKNNIENKKLTNKNEIKNNIENKKLTNKNEIKNMQNKYLINNKQKEINNFNKENELINNKLNNEKMKNKNNKLNLEEIRGKNNNKNKKENKITVISEIEKSEINMILDKYIKRLNSINKIYCIKFDKINKNIKYSEKIIFVATTEFKDVKKINNSIINIQNKYNIESEKINILFVKKKSNFVNITLLKILFKKYKILKK